MVAEQAHQSCRPQAGLPRALCRLRAASPWPLAYLGDRGRATFQNQQLFPKSLPFQLLLDNGKIWPPCAYCK